MSSPEDCYFYKMKNHQISLILLRLQITKHRNVLKAHMKCLVTLSNNVVLRE